MSWEYIKFEDHTLGPSLHRIPTFLWFDGKTIFEWHPKEPRRLQHWEKCIPWQITCTTTSTPLRWRHNDHAGVSNHQPPGCLLNRLFRRKSKKTSKLRVTGLCAGNSPGTGEFSAQMASYAENVSIWWRHHAKDSLVLSIDNIFLTVSFFSNTLDPWE